MSLALGSPALPVVNWPESPGHEREDRWPGPVLEDPDPDGLGWRTALRVAGDEITGADRDRVRANHRGRALLYCVEPSRGLTGKDFTALG